MLRTRAPSRSRVRREEVTRGHDVDGLVGALGDAGREERGDVVGDVDRVGRVYLG